MEEEIRLVKKAAHGNVKAYGLLIAKYQDQLYRITYLRVKDEHLALDIIQDTIVHAYEQIKTLKKARYFKTWIIRILLNQINDCYRKHKKEMVTDQIEMLSEGNSDTMSDCADLHIDLVRAMDQLPEKWKNIVVLKYFQMMKISEISDVLGMPEGSVKAYLSQARTQLKAILGEDYIYE